MNEPCLTMPVSPLVSAINFKAFTDKTDYCRIAIKTDDIERIYETNDGVSIVMKGGDRFCVLESFDEVMQILSNPFYNVQVNKDS